MFNVLNVILENYLRNNSAWNKDGIKVVILFPCVLRHPVSNTVHLSIDKSYLLRGVVKSKTKSIEYLYR